MRKFYKIKAVAPQNLPAPLSIHSRIEVEESKLPALITSDRARKIFIVEPQPCIILKKNEGPEVKKSLLNADDGNIIRILTVPKPAQPKPAPPKEEKKGPANEKRNVKFIVILKFNIPV